MKCNITHSLHAYHCPQDNITVPLGTISLACRCGSITKSPFAPALVYSRIAKGLYLLVLLFCMLSVYLVDDAEHHVQSESHRFCGETLGHVVIGVIIMAHDGILGGESD